MWYLIQFIILYIKYSDSLDKKILTIEGNEEVTQKGVYERGFQSLYTTVIIKNGITGLANDAFRNCNKLLSIDIPPTVKYVGTFSFGQCALQSISFSPGLETLKDHCFYSCFSLVSVSLPSTIKCIGYGIFRGCHSMREIYIDKNCQNFHTNLDNSVIISNNNTLISCTANETLKVPAETIQIAQMLCYQIESIKHVVFEGNKVERIEKEAFYGSGLKSITLPSSILYLGPSIFSGTPLESIIIPQSLESADDEVFSGSSLKSVIIETGCKGMIQDKSMVVFNKNKDIILFVPYDVKEITIPKTVSEIGNTTLQISESLTHLNVESNHPNFSTYDNALYNKDMKCFLACSGGLKVVNIALECIQLCENAFKNTKIEEVKFGDSKVKRIERSCFERCSKLTQISLPRSLEFIGVYGFYKASLQNLVLKFPTNFTTLKDSAMHSTLITEADFSACTKSVTIATYTFRDCSNLAKVVLPSNIKEMTLLSFSGISITSIVITQNVQTIGNSVFSSCKSLKNVTFNTNVLKSIGNNAFDNTAVEEIILPNSVLTLNSYSFANCRRLSKFVISVDSKLQVLSTYVFSGCSSLKHLYLGKYVKEVKPRALAGMYGLTSIEVSDDNAIYSSDGIMLLSKAKDVLYAFPGGIGESTVGESVREIADSAFFDCINLKKVNFSTSKDGNGLHKIGESTFSGCTNLLSISIPCCLEELSANAFEGCFNLSAVSFADNSRLKVLESGVFTACEKLTSVTFGDGSQLSEIGVGAFKQCYSLSSFKFPPNVTKICDSAFESCSSIRSVELPEGILSIGSNAFKGCSSCSSFFLPGSITSIGAGALSNCPSVTSIVYCGLESFSGIDILGDSKQIVSVKAALEGEMFGRSPVHKILDGDCNMPTSKFTMMVVSSSPFIDSAILAAVVWGDDNE